jgi:hypothetical protein
MAPSDEWPHHFIHTLEGAPKNWYIDQELRFPSKASDLVGFPSRLQFLSLIDRSFKLVVGSSKNSLVMPFFEWVTVPVEHRFPDKVWLIMMLQGSFPSI